MRNKRTLLAVAAALAVCIIIAWSATSLQGRETVYEVRPQISVPEYRSDAARAIDAYEHMMERSMDLNERNLKKQLDYASAICKYAAIVGENEKKEGKVTLRNLESGKEELVSVDQALAKIRRTV